MKRKRIVAGGEKMVENGTATSPSPLAYEKIRQQRIKENMERMRKLGIPKLSQNLSLSSSSSAKERRGRTSNPSQPTTTKTRIKSNPLPPPEAIRRRSSRLENSQPVSYAEKKREKSEMIGSSSSSTVLAVGHGRKVEEEVYTEEHIKFLGSCRETWTLKSDGYGGDGHRVYDSTKGSTCHQCRQKTLGHHTRCNRCQLVSGQICGDCLYMRYGENVLEVKENPSWICPVCRGICNCSVCRFKKGWPPTGCLYKKVRNQGYESVAHYLVLTRQTIAGDQASVQPGSLKRSSSLCLDADVASKSRCESIAGPSKKSKMVNDSVQALSPKPDKKRKKAKKSAAEKNVVTSE